MAGAWVALAGALVGSASPAGAAPLQASPAGAITVLDVPYIPQSPALCGGAAAAMVLRYWGQRGVWDSDFAHLVDPETQGIRTTELVAELRDRGTQVLLLDGSLDALSRALEDGRPPMVLLRVGPDRYHYVVVVARGAGVVLYHDPAESPFRLLSEREFTARWLPAGSWAVVVLPSDTGSRPAPEAAPPDPSASPNTDRAVPAHACDPLLEDAVRLAGAGDRGAARERLEAAARICAEAAAPLRELAALRFLDEDWSGAIRLAEAATSLDPDDHHAWRILATSRYLGGDPDGALSAWNVVDEPRVDLLSVPGLQSVRHRVVQERVGLAPGSLLTPAALTLARHRLDELPVARRTGLTYAPTTGGLAELTAGVAAGSGLDLGVPLLARAGIDALARSQVVVPVSSPTGRGELVEATWRWQGNRPRVALSIETPEPAGIPGILRLEAWWEAETYAVGSGAVERETRRGGTATLSRWVAPNTRASGGLGIERWSSRSLDVVVSAGLEQRVLRDHGALEAEAAAGLAGGYTTWRLGTRWRTSTEAHTGGLLAYAGVIGVGGAAPRGLWPGAGTGRGRDQLLRAHPLLADGIIVGEAFGRHLLHASAEGQTYPVRLGPLPLGVAVFADAARAGSSPSTAMSSPRWFVDVGLGLRVGLPGLAKDLRLDWATGLVGGGSALSFGWQRSWQ